MLTINFHNDGTGSEAVGNYDATVNVNGLVLERLRVEGHERAKGWRELLGRLLAPAGDVARAGKECDNVKGEKVMCWTEWYEMMNDDFRD